VPIIKTGWQKILDTIVDKRNKYIKNSISFQQKYILDSIIRYFECFGIFSIVWLSDLRNDFTRVNLADEFKYMNEHFQMNKKSKAISNEIWLNLLENSFPIKHYENDIKTLINMEAYYG
jgi:hypothetical protein